MDAIEKPSARPLLLRPWVPWLLGASVPIVGWAFVENVHDRDWILAGCFGVMTLGLIIQLAGVVWIRRHANRRPKEAGGPAARPIEPAS